MFSFHTGPKKAQESLQEIILVIELLPESLTLKYPSVL